VTDKTAKLEQTSREQTNKTSKHLATAREELVAVVQLLATLDAERGEALKSSGTFSKWRARHEEAEQEQERLALLIETLETEAEQADLDAAREALAARKADLQKRTSALARRITKEGAAAAAVLVGLAAEAKANADEISRLNRELGPDDEQLLSADHLARYRDPLPRKDLEETTVELWTFAKRPDEIVSDPSVIVEREPGVGFIPPTTRGLHPTHVQRRKFRQIRYLEAGAREYLISLGEALKLPRFDGPGMLFDRGRAVEPAERRELLQIVPMSAKRATEAA
jgi:hypothetical protein